MSCLGLGSGLTVCGAVIGMILTPCNSLTDHETLNQYCDATDAAGVKDWGNDRTVHLFLSIRMLHLDRTA